MKVLFSTRELQQWHLDYRMAQRSLGKDLARKYIQRVDVLMDADNVPQLLLVPGLKCHQLKGDRKGQWAISLDQSHRLIFTVADNRMEVIQVEEVSKHYGD
jgi:proteic killer suppression protein